MIKVHLAIFFFFSFHLGLSNLVLLAQVLMDDIEVEFVAVETWDENIVLVLREQEAQSEVAGVGF